LETVSETSPGTEIKARAAGSIVISKRLAEAPARRSNRGELLGPAAPSTLRRQQEERGRETGRVSAATSTAIRARMDEQTHPLPTDPAARGRGLWIRLEVSAERSTAAPGRRSPRSAEERPVGRKENRVDCGWGNYYAADRITARTRFRCRPHQPAAPRWGGGPSPGLPPGRPHRQLADKLDPVPQRPTRNRPHFFAGGGTASRSLSA